MDAMLRLAAKLVSFFWRREDIPEEEEVGQPGRELSEGKGALRRKPSRQACEVGRSCDPLGSGFLRWFGGSVVREQAFGSLGLALATFANPSGLYLLVIFSERKKRRVILHGCLGPVPWLPHCPFPSLFVILCHKRQPDIAAPSLPGFGPPLSSQWDD